MPWERSAEVTNTTEKKFVVVKDEAFNRADRQATPTIDIKDFVEVSEIDPVFLRRPDHLEPQRRGGNAHALLRGGVAETGKAEMDNEASHIVGTPLQRERAVQRVREQRRRDHYVVANENGFREAGRPQKYPARIRDGKFAALDDEAGRFPPHGRARDLAGRERSRSTRERTEDGDARLSAAVAAS